MIFEVDGLEWTAEEDSLIRQKYGANGKWRHTFYPSGLPRLWKIASEWVGEKGIYGRRFSVEIYCGGRHTAIFENEHGNAFQCDGPSNIAIAWALWFLCGGDLPGKIKEIRNEKSK